ncbi:vWA domain-containing protein [Kitasatospora sp. NPDC001175]|uniref:vWA domain-containing protein n=1 Tax=Kitasatospora sp. NPDC001175 TaxID=3157103 RepID=UPI003D05521F
MSETKVSEADQGAADAAEPVNALPERLTGFVQALRGHGLRIGPGESVDAASVLAVLGLTDRAYIREGLAAALLRTDGQRAVFDATFDLYFPLGVGTPEAARRSADPGPAGPATAEPVNPVSPVSPVNPADRAVLDDLRERLAEALAADDRAALTRLAGEAVNTLGRYGSGPTAQGWSAYQTLSRLQPETLLARVLAALRAGQPPGFTDRLDADGIRRRIQGFRGLVGTEARRRVAELRGTDQVARRAVAPSTDQVDFLFAGRDQLAELRRTVQPLARKLATRLAARRRKASGGRIDLRRTLRRSLSTGGVPLRPAYRRRRPGRPEIVLLCDVSGSVAGFADFTMLLVQAMRDQFSKVRVFAFVNRTDEVTRLVSAGSADPAALSRRILTEAKVVGFHGNSDYGAALGEFADHYPDALGPRTCVLVLGDARNNGRDPNLPALKRISERARRVYWLNPEQTELWATGDSAAHAYAGLVEMHSCRNARRLGELIARLLPV